MMTTGRRLNTVPTHGIELDLLRVPDELRDHDGMIWADICGISEERGELGVGRRDLHGRSRQYKGRPHQDGVLDLGGEGLRVLDALELAPRRLVHS